MRFHELGTGRQPLPLVTRLQLGIPVGQGCLTLSSKIDQDDYSQPKTQKNKLKT